MQTANLSAFQDILRVTIKQRTYTVEWHPFFTGWRDRGWRKKYLLQLTMRKTS
jgi:hypothetical protein